MSPRAARIVGDASIRWLVLAVVALSVAGFSLNAADGCDITFADGLIVNSGESLSLAGQTICIYAPGVQIAGALDVADSTMVLVQSSEQEYMSFIGGMLRMENVDIASDYGFYFYVNGACEFLNVGMPKRSRLYGGQYPNARIEVRESRLGGIRPGEPASEFFVTDSEILDLVDIDALYTGGGFVRVSGVAPGYVDHWDSATDLVSSGFFYGHLVLTRTYVNSWSVRLGSTGTTVEIEDSKIGWLRAEWSDGPAVIRASEIDALTCYGSHHSVRFEDSLVHRLSMKYSTVRIGGSVRFDELAEPWVESTLTREFGAIVSDPSGSPMPGVALELRSPDGELAWSGISDEEGRAAFEILFDDSNYQAGWTLVAPSLAAMRGVELLTESPIRVSETSADVNGDGTTDVLDVRLVLQAALGLVELTPEQIQVADIDGDGQVTMADAEALASRVIGFTP